MAATSLGMQGFLARMNVTQLGAPILILMILAMMVLPLPAFVLDVFFYIQYRNLRAGSTCCGQHAKNAGILGFSNRPVGNYLAAPVLECRFDASGNA